MRLVLVHGRSQGASSSDKLREKWMGALKAGCEKTGTTLPAVDVRVPFYGELLERETAAGPVVGAISKGVDGDPDPFDAELLLELAARFGITDQDITVELGPGPVEKGAESWPWVLAAERLLSKRIPRAGEEYIRRFMADVHAYLHWPHVRKQVNDLVGEALGDSHAVVVGHSLGTVVAYWTLTQNESSLQVPLMVTLGSPLGIHAIKRHLPTPLGKPACVQRWLNAADTRDHIALFSRLDRDNFPGDIDNLSDVKNPKKNRHGVGGYLKDEIVSKRIAEALLLY